MNLAQAMWRTQRANRLEGEARAGLAKRRLQALVSHARQHSRYFQELYRGLPGEVSLCQLPPTGKRALMARFDDWVTDPQITLDKVRSFMDSEDNIGRWLEGKYLVFTTSGSTGEPVVVLYDRTALNVVSAIDILRSFAHREDLARFVLRGGKSAGLFASHGFYLGSGSIRHLQLSMPWKRRRLLCLDVMEPMNQTVQALNRFQPAMLGGYPTALELLAEEQLRGRLRIAPQLLMTGGEQLRAPVRQALTQAFGCTVQTHYSSTEGGTMACECPAGRFHPNDDWLILEPVDEYDRPVAPGTLSHGLLLTNLANFAQPMIRYRLTDRVAFHEEPCACGRPGGTLEVEGRTDEVLRFSNGVRVAPLGIYALIREVPGVRRFQLIQHPGDRLELRLEAEDRAAAFDGACRALKGAFERAGAAPSIELSEQLPQPHPLSGKFQHIIVRREGGQ